MLPDEEQFGDMAKEIDEFFAKLCIKNKIDPFHVSAVIFARISRIATELGYMDEHIQLLESIAEKCKGLSIGDVDTSVVH